MTDESVNRVSALIAGVELALVHFGNVLAQRGVIATEELAASLVATADLPAAVKNREVVRLPLLHIAQGLRGTAPGLDELKRALLH
jgi:hypothetical protein